MPEDLERAEQAQADQRISELAVESGQDGERHRQLAGRDDAARHQVLAQPLRRHVGGDELGCAVDPEDLLHHGRLLDDELAGLALRRQPREQSRRRKLAELAAQVGGVGIDGRRLLATQRGDG